jgi:DNA-binding MarR family transcriptional regulator
MPSRLRDEIKQSRPFRSAREEAYLSIIRTAAVLEHGFADPLKEFGITGTQYNVLRILRGAGESGLCRNEVRDRLVSQVPDVTRLLDRMEDAGHVARERDADDRRLVTTRITPAGLQLLADLEKPVAAIHQRQLGHLTDAQLKTLIELLAIARERS